MLFSKLNLTGFKSFVDETELLIEPGMTGIVGPNGCGKSNLVEALRWAMGEASARRLRGEEMDDLIFGGTVNRPARNIAEVTLSLDNSQRTAPPAFNNGDELEITRRIERGAGSHYRINGKEVRARDVQVLFADAATGSRSTALVNQGQVETLIQARAIDRRALLEEAAGITGLYSRRHESELRLKAAETNLERLEDVVAALETQLAGLKRQGRQATRYKNLSDHIRKAEAVVLYLRWTTSQAAFSEAHTRLDAATTTVQELTRKTGTAVTRQAEAMGKLPELRQAEAEAAAALQHVALARDALNQEEARVTAALDSARERIAQNATDEAREAERLEDAKAAVIRLEAESKNLQNTAETENAAESEAKIARGTAKEQVTDLESRLAELAERVAGAEARRADLADRMISLEARKARLGELLAQAEATHESLAPESSGHAKVADLETVIAAARNELDALREKSAAADKKRQALNEDEAVARDQVRAAEDTAAELRAEAHALVELLEVADSELWLPLIDAVTVEPGLEAALGAALGDDLAAPADEAAPVHWRTLDEFDSALGLPDGVPPLSNFVSAPKALARRLSQIGVVDDIKTGARLASDLKPGQKLVTSDGVLWRWDGYTIADAGASQSARRLSQRNRLNALESERAKAKSSLTKAQTDFEAIAIAARDAAMQDHDLRAAMREAENALETRRAEHDHLVKQAAESNSKLHAAHEATVRLTADIEETDRDAAEVRESQTSLRDTDEHRTRLDAFRKELIVLRAALAERQRAYDLLARETAARRQRVEDIAREHDSWSGRAATAHEHLNELTARKQAIKDEIAVLADRPAAIQAERMDLADTVEAAEAKRSKAADTLAYAETDLRIADTELRAEETRLAASREDRVRTEGQVEQAGLTLDTLRERIEERLECIPSALAEIGAIDAEDPPEQDPAERRFERLVRERDNMAPVNLRAHQEAEELGEQIASMESERQDLVKAIARLRQGINELNREGRTRFVAAFEEVNAHFQGLFAKLFGGGRAHLELTESEDPLEAGLEIMASPPGKRLQVLSLLSGGEKALTTIALLFAVFLTNPAPICVLDEVDAPLDDANVSRFCALVEDLARERQTRFLLVTHHRITMARMDRLFGVTMPERGISKLVSVDLQGLSHLKAIA